MVISDYLSIWEVAHRWHGIDPNKSDPNDLPIAVQDALRFLCSGVLNNELTPYMLDAVLPEEGYYDHTGIRAYHVTEFPPALVECAFDRKYDKLILDQYSISRHGLFERCIHMDVEFPDFWMDEKLLKDSGVSVGEPPLIDQKSIDPNSSSFDKIICQAIARTLWDIYPQLNLTAMAKHPAILRYGNGAIYKGKNTLRDWVREVAPEYIKNKPGRPKTSKPNPSAA